MKIEQAWGTKIDQINWRRSRNTILSSSPSSLKQDRLTLRQKQKWKRNWQRTWRTWLDLTLQCHCRVSRVRAVWHWRGVPPACRVRRVSPANGVTGAKRAPWETRVYQVDYHETILPRREKTKDKAPKKSDRVRPLIPRGVILPRKSAILRTYL